MKSPLTITSEIEQLRQEIRQKVDQQDSDYHEGWLKIKDDLLADFVLVPMTLKALLSFYTDPYGCCCVGPAKPKRLCYCEFNTYLQKYKYSVWLYYVETYGVYL